MYKKTDLLFLMANTPLHVGSGQDLGIVDLPIQRERHTSFPKIEASSLKGAIREAFEKGIDTFSLNDATIQINRNPVNQDLYLVFGPEGDFAQNNAHAGAIGFSDARILLFPVKSMKGVFAWITCPMVLEQFKKDMQIIDEKFKMNIPKFDVKENECYTSSSDLKIGENIILEEYTFKVKGNLDNLKVNDKPFGDWLTEHLNVSQWSEKLKTDIVVLSNDDFRDFVNLSTEVITRTKIDNETGTVETGALWTEEYLPSETVMYSIVFASDVYINNEIKEKYKKNSILVKDNLLQAENIMQFLENGLNTLNNYIQIGGNATLGKGITYLKLMNYGK